MFFFSDLQAKDWSGVNEVNNTAVFVLLLYIGI